MLRGIYLTKSYRQT